MSQKFHVIPTKLAAGQKFDKATSTLTLNEAGVFNITIKEFQDEYQGLNEKFNTKTDNL